MDHSTIVPFPNVERAAYREPDTVAMDEYTTAFGDWAAATTKHWSLAQRRLDGEPVSAVELQHAVDDFEGSHRRLIVAVERL